MHSIINTTVPHCNLKLSKYKLPKTKISTINFLRVEAVHSAWAEPVDEESEKANYQKQSLFCLF
eukprot:c38483_g1_i1 orf=84-275(-)